MSKDKKNIALLTTWYPPSSGVAVNRMKAFVHYLSKEKYNVFVITIGKGNEPKEEEYFPGVFVCRIEDKQFLHLPQFKNDPKWKHYLKVIWKMIILNMYAKNEHKQWSKAALKQLVKIHKENNIDLLISSYAPVAPHLVALEFCKQHKEVKWIVDMRDEMSMNLIVSEKTRKYYKLIEQKISKRADALTTVSKPIVDYFRETIPHLEYYEEIRNGFDHDMNFVKNTTSEYFKILYAGNFYGKRKPDTFLQAVSYLYSEGEMPDKWQIHFVGTPHNFSIPKNIYGHIKFIDKVSQKESIEMMDQADLNLLIQPSLGRKGIYTGKIFDYLSVLKPVFAVIDKTDVAAALISELKAGYICGFDNVAEIKNQLKNAISDWKKGTQPIPDKVDIMKLHRKYQVKKLEVLIDNILSI